MDFTIGHGQQPCEWGVAAGNQARVLQEVAQAKRRFGLPETAPVVSCDEAGREPHLSGETRADEVSCRTGRGRKYDECIFMGYVCRLFIVHRRIA